MVPGPYRPARGSDAPFAPMCWQTGTSAVFAVISDIHGNLEALETVMADIARRSIKRIYCLGDVIGYGASPGACLDLVIDRCELALCGNHDQAVFYEPSNFNVGAERAAYWTRQKLEDEPNKAKRDRRWAALGADAHSSMRPRD